MGYEVLFVHMYTCQNNFLSSLLYLISSLSLEEAGIIGNADHGHFDRKL